MNDTTAPSAHQAQRTAPILLIIFGILLVGYVVNAMDRTSFGVLVPAVRTDYGFSQNEAGLLSTVSNLGLGIAGFPVGYLIVRYSRKHMFNIGIFVFSAATLLTIFSITLWDMLFWRIMTGVGESLQLTALYTIAGVLFSRYRGTAVGAVNTAFALGSFIGPSAAGALLDAYNNWHVPMIVYAGIGFLVFLGTLFVPAKVIDRRPGADDHQERRVVGGATTLRNRNTYLLIPASALGGLVTFAYLGQYPTFLQDHLGYSAGTSGLVEGFAGIGALASLFGGFLGDRLNQRTVLVSSYLGTAIVGIVMFAGPTDVVSQSILSLFMGIIFSGIVYVCLAGGLVKSLDQSLAGIGSGIFMTSLYIPAAFAGYLIAAMASSWGWVTAGVIQVGIFSIVGAILCAFLKPESFSQYQPAAKTVSQDPITSREDNHP